MFYKCIFINSEKPMKIDDVTVCDTWDPENPDWDLRGGFNYSNEKCILRWVTRGDTICEVELPPDAEAKNVVNSKTPGGILVANKIILRNPIPISDELTMELYKKADMPIKTYYETIAALAIRGCYNTALQIIRDKVTLDNIDEVINEYDNFIKPWHKDNMNQEVFDQIRELLYEIKSDLLISITIDKEPYIKELTNDKVINLTGQSGSGKSTYAKEHFMNDEYLVVDTDDLLSEDRFKSATGINKELGEYLRNKYEVLPNCFDTFDLLYDDILDYCSKYDKTIVIDCAQFHCIKDINKLKGKIIILRTCIDNCFNRTIERYKEINPDLSEEELNKYTEHKKALYKWYKFSNEFIKKTID